MLPAMDVPPEVLARIAATVREVTEVPELAAFGIGRSERPTATCHELGADAAVEVYRADTEDEAGTVELDLARRFARHPKWRNPGPARSEGTRVYVALWADSSLK